MLLLCRELEKNAWHRQNCQVFTYFLYPILIWRKKHIDSFVVHYASQYVVIIRPFVEWFITCFDVHNGKHKQLFWSCGDVESELRIYINQHGSLTTRVVKSAISMFIYKKSHLAIIKMKKCLPKTRLSHLSDYIRKRLESVFHTHTIKSLNNWNISFRSISLGS